MSNSTRSTLRSSAETLEPRRLLAATITGGVLVATGTDAADEISVRRVLTDDVVVTINGAAQTFDMDDFTGVRLDGRGGGDTFRLVDPLVSPVVRNTTVLGGSGNDRLVYSARTAPLHFRIDPVAPTSTVTSGVQVDHFVAVETLVGGSGDDSFGLAQEDRTYDPAVSFRLEGRDGNDVFVDSIYPSSDAYGFVTMLGGAGDDRFFDESDMRFTREVFFGEAGNDSVRKERSAGTFDGGSGIDTLHFLGGGGGDLRNFPGFENATASYSSGGTTDAPIHLTGTDGPNHLSISGSGTIQGLGGDDTLVGSEQDDTLEGGDGNDLLLGVWGNDELDGGPGTDAADGGVGDDIVTNAEIIPGVGRIRISNRVLTAEGTWGGELITIERVGIDNVIVRVDGLAREFDMDDFDAVLLKGGAGYDQITVLASLMTPVERKVTLEGGDGNDILDGNDGNDVLRGGNGNDEIRGGAGRNALFGDAGNDFLSASGAALPSFLDGGAGNDFIYADNGIKDTVLGGSGNDDEATVDTLDETLGIEHLLVR